MNIPSNRSPLSRHDTSYAPIDFDSLNKVDFDVPAIYKNRQTSQEFQLAFNTKVFKGLAGIYYIDANAYNKFDVRLLGTSTFTEGVDTRLGQHSCQHGFERHGQPLRVAVTPLTNAGLPSCAKFTWAPAGSPAMGAPRCDLVPYMIPISANPTSDRTDKNSHHDCR